MITYELAKKLKDAGFKYSEFIFQHNLICKHNEGKECVNCIKGEDYWYDIPTLEELIEAMPMRKKYLGTVNDAHFVLRKLVGQVPSYRAYYEDEDTSKSVEGYEFISESPSEAVAKLWLALNSLKK